MIQRGRGTGLAGESFEAFVVMDHLRRQNLDGYLASEGRVEGAIDAAHAALADECIEAIAAERPSDDLSGWL